MKMETFSRDSYYLKHRLGLNIEVGIEEVDNSKVQVDYRREEGSRKRSSEIE